MTNIYLHGRPVNTVFDLRGDIRQHRVDVDASCSANLNDNHPPDFSVIVILSRVAAKNLFAI